jgi:HD-GYP domain-containing protein (c-di-GMP phosphodiesterase class II)
VSHTARDSISSHESAAGPRLAGLFAAMEYVVLSPGADGHFVLLTEPGEWFHPLTVSPVGSGHDVRLRGQSDYLDYFLIDADKFWARAEAGRLCSGTWVESDAAGNTRPLAAQAVYHDKNAFLLIEHVSASYAQQVKVLQAAREHLLNEETLERAVASRTAAIRQREEEIAMRLLAAAGTRDEETGSHVRRIGLFAAAVGQALGWNAERVADIRVAAPMHDIGKIGIPDAILLKPGKLTADEYRIMQQHTVIGAKMLGGSDIPLLVMSDEIALCHHERWDGSGYPKGKRGEEIPIAARIVAIVDVYDAMLHRRVYKAPIAETEVLRSMTAEGGSHFDPALLDVFISILPLIREIRAAVQE